MEIRWSSYIPVSTTSSFWPGLSSIFSLLLVVNYRGPAAVTGGIQVYVAKLVSLIKSGSHFCIHIYHSLTDTCVEFDRSDGTRNLSFAENATSPVKEFWE